VAEQLGKYRLVKAIGEGGMAEVFLAEHTGPAGFHKQVVIKRIRRSKVNDKSYVDLFLREARIAARLNHPNLVQVYELGEQDDDFFIVMEYLVGMSLRALSKVLWDNDQELPVPVILRSIAEASRGLHYAHHWSDAKGERRALVHRDISPDNIFLTADGVTKVLDFGIATAADEQLLTATGEIKGKVPYMAPEQLRSEPLDGRSDLWSLGVTLYYLLCRVRPFEGARQVQTMHAILQETPVAPRQWSPHLSVELNDFVMQMLEKEANRRPATGNDVADRIYQMLGAQALSMESGELVRKAMLLANQNMQATVVDSAPNLSITFPSRSAVSSHVQITDPAMADGATQKLSTQLADAGGQSTVLSKPPPPQPKVFIPPAAFAAPHVGTSPVLLNPPRRSWLMPVMIGAMLVVTAVLAWWLGSSQTEAPIAKLPMVGVQHDAGLTTVDAGWPDAGVIAVNDLHDAGTQPAPIANVTTETAKQNKPPSPRDAPKSEAKPVDVKPDAKPVDAKPPEPVPAQPQPTPAPAAKPKPFQTDVDVVSSCGKPCAQRYRDGVRDNLGTPESRAYLLSSCARQCRAAPTP
jgi:serine/threonine protein kinase